MIRDYYEYTEVRPAMVSFAKHNGIDIFSEDWASDALFAMITKLNKTKDKIFNNNVKYFEREVTPWIVSRSEKDEVIIMQDFVWVNKEAEERYSKLSDIVNALRYHYEGFFE